MKRPDTAGAWLRAARDRLEKAGSQSAALDARMLLLDGLNIPHSVIISDPELSLNVDECEALEAMLVRRETSEPVSRILGSREFWGRHFHITPDVLDPRPDTETLIDAVLKSVEGTGIKRILDIGTGSGCIAITLLLERPEWQACASDVSDAALEIARGNADALNVLERIEFVQTNWAEGIDGGFDIICSNPPYITSSDIGQLDRDVRDFDPIMALDGGTDGLDAYRAIFAQIPDLLTAEGQVFVELGAGQFSAVKALCETCDLEVCPPHNDLSGHERVLHARKP
ncbi:MAG: peptide chain release factor N(5)-glutamine methyltransferase [Hyphomicrobiales bacterium]